MSRFGVVFLCLVLLVGCKEENIDPRAKYKYHIFVRQKASSRAFYAGTTVGLGSCAIIGIRTLVERVPHELRGYGWKVVCCWWTKTSQCQEEHDYKYKDVPYEEWIKDPKYHRVPKRQHFFKKNSLKNQF